MAVETFLLLITQAMATCVMEVAPSYFPIFSIALNLSRVAYLFSGENNLLKVSFNLAGTSGLENLDASGNSLLYFPVKIP
jgi:hypothetical protein